MGKRIRGALVQFDTDMSECQGPIYIRLSLDHHVPCMHSVLEVSSFQGQLVKVTFLWRTIYTCTQVMIKGDILISEIFL